MENSSYLSTEKSRGRIENLDGNYNKVAGGGIVAHMGNEVIH